MYQALYRKWRPSTFEDVYGQPHITKTLKNELESGRISHAYLFTGSRGTGKTTCAKILAKAVNCLNPVNGNPCNECEICRGIDNGSILDVLEIDAASNNSVDDIRDINEKVNFATSQANYRVYIIDEVHMLSMNAFNALLKTLEEPPAHVIFILATTELHKMPATILSRCQRFDFKRISSEDIISRINYIAEKENVTITEEAASIIANIADGGMRDALSLMDRCLSISPNITEDVISSATGIAGTKYLFEFSGYIANSDFTGALKLISKLHNESTDIDSLCSSLCDHFRNLMVSKTVDNIGGLIICSKEDNEKYKRRSEELKLSTILKCLDILNETSYTIKTAQNKKIQLESALIKMCSFNTGSINSKEIDSKIISRIENLEKKLSVFENQNTENKKQDDNQYNPFLNPKKKETILNSDNAEPKNMLESKSDTTVHKKDEKISTYENKQETKSQESVNNNNEPNEGSEVIPDGPFSEWPDVIENLMKTDMPLYGLMYNTSAVFKENRLIIMTDNASLHDFICSEKHVQFLRKSIFEVSGKKPKIRIKCDSNEEKSKVSLNPLDNLKEKINEFNTSFKGE